MADLILAKLTVPFWNVLLRVERPGRTWFKIEMTQIHLGVLMLDNKPAATASTSEKCCSVCIRGTKSVESFKWTVQRQLSGSAWFPLYLYHYLHGWTGHWNERLVGKLNLLVMWGPFLVIFWRISTIGMKWFQPQKQSLFCHLNQHRTGPVNDKCSGMKWCCCWFIWPAMTDAQILWTLAVGLRNWGSLLADRGEHMWRYSMSAVLVDCAAVILGSHFARSRPWFTQSVQCIHEMGSLAVTDTLFCLVVEVSICRDMSADLCEWYCCSTGVPPLHILDPGSCIQRGTPLKWCGLSMLYTGSTSQFSFSGRFCICISLLNIKLRYVM